MASSSQKAHTQRSKQSGPFAQRGRLPAATTILNLELDHGRGSQRLYRQIRDHIRSAILTGSLGIDTRLPAERELATALGVNRATVVRAYQELSAEGLVVARGSRGTLVAPMPDDSGGHMIVGSDLEPAWLLDVATHRMNGLGPDPTVIRELVVSGARPGVIPFAAAGPGPELLPLDELRTSLEVALGTWGAAPLRYGPVEGFEPLRQALRERYASEVIGENDEVMVVSGATQGLEVAARALIEPGDAVLVEAPAYVGTIQAFGLAGAQLVGIPVDQNGIRVDLMEKVLSRRRVRLIAVQPTFHNPTGASLSPARREHLLGLARRYAVPVLEDDPYRLLRYDGAPTPPLKGLDRHANVIYLSSFSKSVAPGLRLGWMAAHRSVLSRLALAKQFSDLNSGGLAQAAMAYFISSGRYDAHVRRTVPVYRERRSALIDELARQTPDVVPMTLPQGGFHVWCRLPVEAAARQVMAAASRFGVSVVAGQAFYPPYSLGRDSGHDRLRLSFPEVPPEAAREGVRRLAQAVEEASSQSVQSIETGTRVLI